MVKRNSLIWQISIIFCLFPSILVAKTSANSILPDGARIVAGDLSRNEFFILAKGEKAPIHPSKKAKSQAIIHPKLLAQNNITK